MKDPTLKDSVFDSIPLHVFADWARDSGLYGLQIMRIERWKFLSSLAFWHEFLLVTFEPSTLEIPPPSGSISSSDHSPYYQLLRNGLALRFDRRVVDDFVCLVAAENRGHIALECTLVAVATHRHFEQPFSDRFIGPSLKDLASFLQEMLRQHSPSYNLFSKNCWTFANAAFTMFIDVFAADLVLEPLPAAPTTSKMTLRRKLKIWLGQKFGNNDYAYEVLMGESLGVLQEVILQSNDWHYAQSDTPKEVIRAIANRLDPRRRLVSKYKRDKQSMTTITVPISDHPFRGYLRALEKTDELIKENKDALSDLVMGLSHIASRPEWASYLPSPGPHLEFSRQLGPTWRKLIETGETEFVILVILPLIMLLFDPEFDSPQTIARSIVVYEVWMKNSSLLDDLMDALRTPQIFKPSDLSMYIKHTPVQVTIPGILGVLTAAATNVEFRLKFASRGCFAPLFDLLKNEKADGLVFYPASMLVLRFCYEKYNDVEHEELLNICLNILSRRDVSRDVLGVACQSLVTISVVALTDIDNQRARGLFHVLESRPNIVQEIANFFDIVFGTGKRKPKKGMTQKDMWRMMVREGGFLGPIALLIPVFRLQEQFSLDFLKNIETFFSGITCDEEVSSELRLQLLKDDNVKILSSVMSGGVNPTRLDRLILELLKKVDLEAAGDPSPSDSLQRTVDSVVVELSKTE